MRMALAEQAQEIAQRAHAQQVDKAGRPYIEHPARVAARLVGDELGQAVAWLHDVVEDTPVTPAQLLEQGFPSEVVDAVVAVTRVEGELPEAYYARVTANPLALSVKLADIADNSDPERLAALDEATSSRLTAKYDKARAALAAAASSTDVPIEG